MTPRGWNLWAHCSEQDVIDAVATGATLLRYQIMPEGWIANTLPISGWDVWVAAYVNYLEKIVLPNLGGASLILDLHTAPGGISRSRHVCLRNPTARQKFLECWQTIAERFVGETRILSYGVLNEPQGPWKEIQGLMIDAHALITRIDPSKIVCLAGKNGSPRYMNRMITVAGAWHELHMYQPLSFTHQGLARAYRAGRRYPTSKLNKSHLYKALRHAIALTKQGTQIFVGEFSVSTFADPASREAYLSDCISIFKEFNWPWCFHAWREAPVWNGENVSAVMNNVGGI